MKCFIFPILFGASVFHSVHVVVAAPVTNVADLVISSTDSSQAADATTINRADIFAFTSWEPKDASSPDSEPSKRDVEPIFAKDTWESEKRNDQIFAVIAWEPEESESSASSATAMPTATDD
ncbi:hypothetical protein D9758_000044 [Tetrapyrgos nigripes]|uniref:Uncharacterized protein n=1 Tax=Tetrapyrgos nigripes TaxID=182062 RepID=A0A8H5H1T5_9AGAR|nr:hypothetical protein D9758_000044 [Tetrapyrgos nigripes]